MSDVVKVEMQGDIALLIFNRPANLNALNTPLARGIAETLIALDGDPAVKGIVLIL